MNDLSTLIYKLAFHFLFHAFIDDRYFLYIGRKDNYLLLFNSGDVSLLQIMPIQGARCLDTYRNGNQQSPYHIMTNNQYTQDRQLNTRVASILREKDLAVSFMDDKKHLSKDYDLKEQFGELNDELKRTSASKFCFLP